MPLCEVQATKCVRTMVGLCNNTDDIEAVYLPTYMSIRSCYASYLDRLGYSITTFNDGNYKVGQWSGEDGEEGPPSVSLPTFYNVWKQDFVYIKVSSPAEDECTLCFPFMNHHKYAIALLADSLTDNSLFIVTPMMMSPGSKTKRSPPMKRRNMNVMEETIHRWSTMLTSPLRRSPRWRGY